MKTLKLNTILNTKKRIETPIDEMRAMKRITKAIIEDLAQLLGLTKTDFIALLPVSPKTVERLKEGIIDDLVLSEHLLHLAKVAREGFDVFEDSHQLAVWLKTPHPFINRLEPYEILRTVTGCNIITDLLGRAKYGIVS